MTSITVVIPAYNVENYIVEAIESVLTQTILPNEIVIINDGSTDNTADMLKKYESNPLIKILHTSNRGLGKARNTGLIEASSEYIYFFDSDDILECSFIEKMINNIKAYNYPDLILFSGESFFDNEQAFQSDFYPRYYRGFSQFFNNSHDLISSLMEKSSFFSSACLYISRRSVWLNNNLKFKSIIHEDEDIIFKLLAYSKSSLVLSDVLFYRRIRLKSIMTTEKTVKNLDGYIESLKSMYNFKDENPDLYKNLKPLWKNRVATLTLTILSLITSLKLPTLDPVIIKGLIDSYSIERAYKLIKLLRKKLFKL